MTKEEEEASEEIKMWEDHISALEKEVKKIVIEHKAARNKIVII